MCDRQFPVTFPVNNCQTACWVSRAVRAVGRLLGSKISNEEVKALKDLFGAPRDPIFGGDEGEEASIWVYRGLYGCFQK